MGDLWYRFKMWLKEIDWFDLGLTAVAMFLAFCAKNIGGALSLFLALVLAKIITGRITK
jgi:hypothetical protein